VAIVATELEHTVKDPRLDMVTVTAATVTPDLREAVVFYTVYDGDDDATAQALASATGVLRTAVGRQTGIKFTPTLAFRPDTVPDNAHRIDELLAAARAADAAVAAQAAGASYAGEPDPYRVPREIDDEFADDGEGADGEGTNGGGSDRVTESAGRSASAPSIPTWSPGLAADREPPGRTDSLLPGYGHHG
jgi:ribosome-binding factor A